MGRVIYFVTNNKNKIETLRHAFKQSYVKIEQLAIETPEIQSESTEEIASYSAKYAAELTSKTVLKEDFGMFIESLNGFPGPFVKYINYWLVPDQFIRMYDREINKRAYLIDTLAYCEFGKTPVCFTEKIVGELISTPLGDNDNMIDSLFIPDGYNKTIAQMTKAESLKFWSGNLYSKLMKYLRV